MEETDSAEKEKGEDEEFDDDGVDSFKIYQTSVGGCNCASKFRSGCPCRHILFLRKTKNINLFDSSLFSLHFSKERNLDLEKEHEDLNFDDDQSIEVDKDNSQHIIDGDSENEETLKTLTREQKYKIVGPLCERLIDAMIKCGTVKVEQYRHELEICLGNVKNGESLFREKEENESPGRVASDDQSPIDGAYPVEEAKKKFDLDWLSNTKFGKIGRPRGSKVSLVKKKNKKTLTKTVRNVVSTISRPRPEDTQLICSFPPNPDHPKQNAIFEGDYVDLAPGSYVSDVLVNFKLRNIQPEGPANQAVWLLSTHLAQRLDTWWDCNVLCEQLIEAKLYEDGGAKIVFLPWMEKNHFFAIIAVTGPQDRLFIMESIGGYEEPRGAALLRNFLKEVRAVHDGDPVDFITTTLQAPKQDVGSNNCALFLLETAAMLVSDPEDFCVRAERKEMDMIDWYPSSQVEGRREELAELLRRLGEEQRQPGHLHEKEEKLNLSSLYYQELEIKPELESRKRCMDMPELVKNAGQNMMKSRKGHKKCGLCKDEGHNRQRCPMKGAKEKPAAPPRKKKADQIEVVGSLEEEEFL